MTTSQRHGITYEKYTLFQCTGSACLDKCCRISTWTITIDRDTYNRYTEIEGVFGDELRQSIYEQEDKIQTFKATADGYCTMQDTDGLCKIHKNLGADYLCATCKTYPRGQTLFNDVSELHLGLSCPEVTKLLLFDKAGLAFRNFTRTETMIKESKSKKTILNEKICFEIRSVLSKILQNRNYSLLDRLIYLGVTMRGLSKVSIVGDYENDLFKKLDFYERQMDNADLLKGMKEKLNVNSDIRNIVYHNILTVIKTIIKPEKADSNPNFYDRLHQLYEQMDNLSGRDLNKIKKNLFDEYMKKNEYVFENYLVNEVFVTRFPYGYDNLYLAYKALISKFLFLQLFITSIYHKSSRLNDEDILSCIYYFYRRINHSKIAMTQIENICKNDETIDLAMLVYLL